MIHAGYIIIRWKEETVHRDMQVFFMLEKKNMKMLKSGKRSGLPNVNMIEIKGHFGTELTRNRTSIMYNENREKEMTIS